MSQYQQPTRRVASETEQYGSGRQSGRRFPTASYLSADVRETMIRRLNRTLADLTVLQKQAKFAHWNVKGMAFYGLHDLFDDLAGALESHVDLVAERITALGGQAMGTAGQAVGACRLPAMPTDAVTGADYVDVLTQRLAVADANLYDDVQRATDQGDVDTADLLNEVSRDVSTYLWFVEAHLQTDPVGTTAPSQRATEYGPPGATDHTSGPQTARPQVDPTQGAQQRSPGGIAQGQARPGADAQHEHGEGSTQGRTEQLVASELQ